MKKIATDIFRQRLLIEGYFNREVGEATITEYFNQICEHLRLKMYGKPIIFSPRGLGKAENQGYDAFVPLIDSGISLYVWSKQKFISLIIYTCKGFDSEQATTFTRTFFNLKEADCQEF